MSYNSDWRSEQERQNKEDGCGVIFVVGFTLIGMVVLHLCGVK